MYIDKDIIQNLIEEFSFTIKNFEEEDILPLPFDDSSFQYYSGFNDGYELAYKNVISNLKHLIISNDNLIDYIKRKENLNES